MFVGVNLTGSLASCLGRCLVGWVSGRRSRLSHMYPVWLAGFQLVCWLFACARLRVRVSLAGFRLLFHLICMLGLGCGSERFEGSSYNISGFVEFVCGHFDEGRVRKENERDYHLFAAQKERRYSVC